MSRGSTSGPELATLGTYLSILMNPRLLLHQVRTRHTQSTLARELKVSAKTVRGWENGAEIPDGIRPELLRVMRGGASRSKAEPPRVVDLFAGIGGIRMGFEENGYRTVFTSEWNKFAVETYVENFGDEHPVVGDIQTFDAVDVPDHDVLLAGFPCQPFSIAGVSKKNALGRPHGFEDRTQGTLFFDVARVIDAKRPRAFLLENVKNLRSHDGGRTFEVIMDTLTSDLGYQVEYRVIDGQHFTPQHRERIVIVGFESSSDFTWDDLKLPDRRPRMGDVLHRTDGQEPFLPWDEDRFFDHARNVVPEKYTLSTKLWEYLQAYAAKHKAAGNGFGFGLVDEDSVSRTLSARYYKDGSEILVSQGESMHPRRLTPRECARLMGFPDQFRIPVSDTQAYKQFGNSVVVPAVREVARIMDTHMREGVPPVAAAVSSSRALVALS